MRRIFLGAQCNNACVFCAQGELRGLSVHVSPEQAIACAEPGETVALMGGEPTLFEELPAWIAALEQRGVSRIVVQTNGRRLAYSSYAGALKAASSKLSLDISLHGSTGPMHDYHTNVPGSFQQTVLGLRNARRAGIDCVVSCVITRSNFRHLHEITALCRSLGVSALRFAKALPLGTAAKASHKDRVIPSPELVQPYLMQAIAEAKRLGILLLSEQEDPQQRFAGLGEVEQPPLHSDEPAKAPRIALPMLNKAAPGKQEVRSAQRKSGEELRDILPAFFEAKDFKEALTPGEERTG